MTSKAVLLVAALDGMLAVILGAFGAHALKGRLTLEALAIYHTASQYHFYHVFALFLVGLLASQYGSKRLLNWSAGCFIAGTLVFCGSLYLLAVTGSSWLGMFTPIGGFAFIIAWLFLAVGAWRYAP